MSLKFNSDNSVGFYTSTGSVIAIADSTSLTIEKPILLSAIDPATVAIAPTGSSYMFIGTSGLMTLKSDSGQVSSQGTQGTGSVAMGVNAGASSQGPYAIAIGYNAGTTNQQTNAIAIGDMAGQISQQSSAIAIGNSAGMTGQQTNTISIGNTAGQIAQSAEAIAQGLQAGKNNQATGAIAIGSSAGMTSQRIDAIAIGRQAGLSSQGTNSIAIGRGAGGANLGINAISIGNNSCLNTGATGSICINASGNDTPTSTGGLYINPIRIISSNPTGTNTLVYNNTTKEITAQSYGIASMSLSANQTISNNTNTTVALNTIVIAPTSNDLSASTGTSLITVNNDGIYEITARVQYTSSPDTGRYQLILLIGGSSSDQIAFSVPNASGIGVGFTPGTDNGHTITSLQSLTAGTTVGIRVNQNSGGNVTLVGGGTARAFLYVRRIL